MCGNGAIDGARAQWELSRFSNRQIVIADLPACQQCTKALKRGAR